MFIVVEGIDGVGKSTLVQQLGAWFKQHGTSDCSRSVATPHRALGGLRPPWTSSCRAEVVVTREPTERFRFYRDQGYDEAEAFIRDRHQHVTELIAPSLQSGRTVICDRYLPSTLAYQGSVSPIAHNGAHRTLCGSMAHNGAYQGSVSPIDISSLPIPDRTLVLCLDPEKARARMKHRNHNDANDLDWAKQCRAHQVYLRLHEYLPPGAGWRISYLDADQPSEQVFRAALVTLGYESKDRMSLEHDQ